MGAEILVFLKSLSSWLGLGTAAVAIYFLKKYVDDTGDAIKEVKSLQLNQNKELKEKSREFELLVGTMQKRTSDAVDEMRSCMLRMEKVAVQFDAFKNFDFKSLEMRLDVLNQIVNRLDKFGPEKLAGKIILIDKEVEVINSRVNAIRESHDADREMLKKMRMLMHAFNEDLKNLKKAQGG